MTHLLLLTATVSAVTDDNPATVTLTRDDAAPIVCRADLVRAVVAGQLLEQRVDAAVLAGEVPRLLWVRAEGSRGGSACASAAPAL